jgi:hypothetical protein
MSPARKTTKAKARKPAKRAASKPTSAHKKAPAKKKPAAKKKAAPKKKTPAKKAKAAPKKKATAKAAPKKAAPAKAPARPEAAPKKKKPARAKRPSRKKTASQPQAGVPGTGVHAKLGMRYVCFECGAKFYDLNRPEPLCPKCGADQRVRPAREVKLKTPAEPAARARPMAPLLDDDEDEAPAVQEEDGLDIGLGVVDSPEDAADEEDEEPEPA